MINDGNLGISQVNPDDLMGDGPRLATSDGTFTDGNIITHDTSGTITDSGVSSADLVVNARSINTTAPLTGGGDLSADLTLAVSTFTGDSGSGGARGVVPAPSAGDAAAGKFLSASGGFLIPSGTSSGTVTSVALTLPSWLSVSGSPVTTSGTLAVTATSGLAANQVLATPNGSTGALSPRALVAADIPAISLTAGISGILPIANGGTGTATPGLVAGTGISLSGSFPTQTVSLAAQPYDIPFSFVGKPGAGATVQIFTAVRALTIAANFSGAYGNIDPVNGANPTATATYTLKKNSSGTLTTIGTVAVSTSGVFAFATTGGTSQSLAAGDLLIGLAPNPQDATMSGVAFTISLTR